jgi:hypothetical protein
MTENQLVKQIKMPWSVQIETFDEAKGRRADLVGILHRGNGAASKVAEQLAACRKGRRCGSGACPVCLRRYRRQLVRGARQIFRANADWTRASIIAADLKVPGGALHTLDLDKAVKRIRKRLERAAPCLRDAVVFGGVDLSFNVENNGAGYWQAHLYLLIAGKRNTALKKAVREAFPPEPSAPRPYRFRTVDNAPAAVTYVFKAIFSRRSRYFVDGEPRTRKLSLKPREHRELMVYLDKFSIGARLLLRGVRRNGNQLQKIAKDKT